MPSASYPVACRQLTSLGFNRAGELLNAAQAEGTQTLRGMRVTYLGLGQFSLEAPRPRRPPEKVPTRQAARQQAPPPMGRGRHAAPSPVAKAAATAGKAGPAVALAGVALVAAAAPHAQAVKAPAVHHPVTRTHATARVTRAHATARVMRDTTYTVQPGDTLSAIAQRIWHHGFGYWVNLYMANNGEIHDPNLIYAGQVLKVPATPTHLDSYTQPKSQQGENENDGGSDSGENEAAGDTGSDSGSDSNGGSTAAQSSTAAAAQSSTNLSGTLGCSGLEQLWTQAGGNSANAQMAAAVAMAESSGQQGASSPAGDVGYWQINEPIWGSTLATSDPMGNAKAAVQISNNGTNWNPWVTYDNGAEHGYCGE